MSRNGLQAWPCTGAPVPDRYRVRFSAAILRERIQALSLDVVAGVVCATMFAVSWTQAHLPLGWWLALPVATWVVYAVDHLLDARRAGPAACDFKHRFFRRNVRPLEAALVAAVVWLCVLALVALPARVVVAGFVLAAVTAVHLVNAQVGSRRVRTPGRFRRWAGPPKELTAAASYTAGIWLVPMLLGGVPPWTGLLAGLLFLAALANLLAFSLLELDTDVRGDQRSAVRSWGVSTVSRWLIGVTLLGIAGVALGGVLGPRRLVPYLVVMLVLLLTPGALWARRSSVVENHRYRTIGDLAFLLLVLPAWLN